MNENPEDIEEQLEENIETQQEVVQDITEDNSPTPISNEYLYSLFCKVLTIKDSSKVANLDKNEIGMLDMSVRDMQRIALVAKTLGHTGFANWMNSQAQIVLRTSSSKKGWFTELFVTAKKFSSKEKRMGMPEIGTQQPEQKKGFWNRFK